jgi:hypothetical protein
MGDTFTLEDPSSVTRLAGTLHLPQTANPGDVLTVQQDRSIKAAPGGGGGGGNVLVDTIPVSSAEILALADVDVLLVPGAAGSTIALVSVGIVYQAGLVPYLDGGGSMRVSTRAAGGGVIAAWTDLAGAGFWDQADSQVFVPGGLAALGNGPLSDSDGQDVILTADNDPTLGDGTLSVTVAYYLIPSV